MISFRLPTCGFFYFLTTWESYFILPDFVKQFWDLENFIDRCKGAEVPRLWTTTCGSLCLYPSHHRHTHTHMPMRGSVDILLCLPVWVIGFAWLLAQHISCCVMLLCTLRLFPCSRMFFPPVCVCIISHHQHKHTQPSTNLLVVPCITGLALLLDVWLALVSCSFSKQPIQTSITQTTASTTHLTTLLLSLSSAPPR